MDKVVIQLRCALFLVVALNLLIECQSPLKERPINLILGPLLIANLLTLVLKKTFVQPIRFNRPKASAVFS